MTTNNEQKRNVESMQFEEAMSEIDTIIGALENGRVTLNTAIECYSRGLNLYKHCKKLLDQANAKAEEIFVNTEGTGAK